MKDQGQENLAITFKNPATELQERKQNFRMSDSGCAQGHPQTALMTVISCVLTSWCAGYSAAALKHTLRGLTGIQLCQLSFVLNPINDMENTLNNILEKKIRRIENI